MTLLFVPLDDRPVTRDAVLDLAAAAGISVRTPERTLLGTRDRGADVHALWSWIQQQTEEADRPAACVAAIEMLCFGGLVPSRRSARHWRNILPWLDRVYALAERVPLYLSAVIPRTPVHGGGPEDPAYWEAHGDALRAYSAAADELAWMGTAAAAQRVAEALQGLPAGVLEAVLQHRRRHLLLNAELLAAASRGALRALLIGQDDTTAAGLSRLDREGLERLAQVLGATTARLLTGADELGAVLLARWVNDWQAARPAVRVVSTYPHALDRVPAYESQPLGETVREHAEAAGCRLVPSGEDILLWVHNFPEEGQGEVPDRGEDLPDPQRVETVLAQVRTAREGEVVPALADVRFANGADDGLVRRLLRERRLAGIVAYAGWNTASNSLGSAMAQAVAVFHLRRFTVPGNPHAAWRMLLARLLDDWGYQAVVRPRLAARLRAQGVDPRAVPSEDRSLAEEARHIYGEAVVPPIAASFGMPVAPPEVSFPWGRLFEAAIGAAADRPAARRRTVVIEAYDPRWPILFAEERERILGTLAGVAAVVEHIGSTAVPGLAARPVVDILVGLPGTEDLDRCIEPLVRLGYEYAAETEMALPHRRYFRRHDADGRRTHHLHVVVSGTPFWQRHLAFRDHLRAHPEKAREYEEVKRRLAAQSPSTIAYVHAKSAFVRAVERLAGVPGEGGRG